MPPGEGRRRRSFADYVRRTPDHALPFQPIPAQRPRLPSTFNGLTSEPARNLLARRHFRRVALRFVIRRDVELRPGPPCSRSRLSSSTNWAQIAPALPLMHVRMIFSRFLGATLLRRTSRITMKMIVQPEAAGDQQHRKEVERLSKSDMGKCPRSARLAFAAGGTVAGVAATRVRRGCRRLCEDFGPSTCPAQSTRVRQYRSQERPPRRSAELSAGT